MKKTLLALISVVVLVPLPLASPADATSADARTSTRAASYAVTVKDDRMPGPARGYDVTKVTMYSASDYEPAVVTIDFATEQSTTGEGMSVWFNLDADNKPEAVLHAGAGSEYLVRKTSDWDDFDGKIITGRRCFVPDLSGSHATVSFTPYCFGKPTTMAVSVSGNASSADDYAQDFAPGEHRWSKRIQAWDKRHQR